MTRRVRCRANRSIEISEATSRRCSRGASAYSFRTALRMARPIVARGEPARRMRRGRAVVRVLFREARFLRTLRLEVNGRVPWLCEATLVAPHLLAFTYIYPELTEFGGGGSGQSGDDESLDADGIPHRALSLRAVHSVGVAGLSVALTITNHTTHGIEADLAWHVDADFADIQEAHAGAREQQAPVHRRVDGCHLHFIYQHSHRTTGQRCNFAKRARHWTVSESALSTRVRLEPQESVVLRIDAATSDHTATRRSMMRTSASIAFAHGRSGSTRVAIPPNRLAERILAANVRDFASFPLLEGPRDEWLTLQAGMPLYPALSGGTPDRGMAGGVSGPRGFALRGEPDTARAGCRAIGWTIGATRSRAAFRIRCAVGRWRS